jgi:tetratricopeptide (TPR) repeat protein
MVDLADRALADGHVGAAENYLQQAEKLLPSTDRVAGVSQRLTQFKAESQQKSRIETLLSAAQQDMKALRLMSPAGKNALERYRSVLEMEPDNTEAKRGIQSVAEQYVQLAEQAIDRAQYESAADLLDKAESVSPGQSSVRRAKERLATRVAQAGQEAEKKLLEEDRINKQKAEQERKKQAEIQALLDRAERSLKTRKLTNPAGDNAVDQFRSVLKLEPGNEKAAQGLRRIGEVYLQLAARAQQGGNLEQADQNLRIAAQLLPASNKVKEARDKLSAEIERAKKKEVLDEQPQRNLTTEQKQPQEVKKSIETSNVATEIEKRPPLTASSLFGSWCGMGYTLKFGNNNWTFAHDGGLTTFSVTNYAVSEDRIIMYWKDNKSGDMVTEFGNFSDNRNALIQIRGKTESDGNWHYYNRSFKRCR